MDSLNRNRLIDYYLGGPLVVLLAIPVRLIGLLLHRRKDLKDPQHLVFIKLLGGGSLFQALPMILTLKRKFPETSFSLVCEDSVRAFAEVYDVFDEIKVIKTNGLVDLLCSGLRVLLWCILKSDVVIDLEIHSRLTTIFSTATLVARRIGFVDYSYPWRAWFYTHAIFFTPSGPVYSFYDGILLFFGIETLYPTIMKEHFSELRKAENAFLKRVSDGNYICIGAGCSRFAAERRLPVESWRKVLTKLLNTFPGVEIVFLGSADDRKICEEINLTNLRIINLAGECGLRDSILLLRNAQAFIGIDSAILHFAREFCPRVVGFWGPTEPYSRLRPSCVNEMHFVNRITCSPCVHVSETPICLGQNVCMDIDYSSELIALLKNELNKLPSRPDRYKVICWLKIPTDKVPQKGILNISYERDHE